MAEYNFTKDADHLETIHNILSSRLIANRLDNDSLKQVNEKLVAKKFSEIIKSHIEDKIGITEFPVVGEDNNYNSIRAFEILDGNENNIIDPKIESNRELFQIPKITQNEIQKKLCDIDGKTRDITILNWGLSFTIREHILKGTKHEPVNYNFKIKGRSLHFAAVIACVSKIFNLSVNSDFIYTGTFNIKGESQRIECLHDKVRLITKERPNTKKIFIPSISKFTQAEQKIILLNNKFVEAENISQLIEKVFDKNLEEIAGINLNARKKIGRARIWAEYIGEKELQFKKDFSTIVGTKKV